MRRTFLAALVLSVAGCAANYRPIVDPARSPANYEGDLADCQRLAGQGAGAGTGAAVGAGLGFGLGVLMCSALGGRNCAGVGTAVAIGGGAQGAAQGGGSEIQAVQRCMIGRGYAVLR